jgi:hypothetical protein
MTDLGSRFVAALAAKDTDRLVALFAPDVDFRGLTPRRFWEADSPQRLVHEVLYEWFEPKDVIERIDYVEDGHAGDRERVDYRLLVRNPDGPFIVEQRAYFDVNEAGRISYMRTICSGYRRTTEPS